MDLDLMQAFQDELTVVKIRYPCGARGFVPCDVIPHPYLAIVHGKFGMFVRSSGPKA